MEIPGVENHFITVNGVTLHYLRAGDAKPLILLHGMGASSASWRDNIVPLSRRYSVYALDAPAHGDSGVWVPDYSPNEMARLVAGFIEQLGLQGSVLIGNSMGGGLAVHVAEQAPHLVDGLVLVDTVAFSAKLPLFVRLATVPLLGELLWLRTLPRDQMLLRVIFHDPHFAEKELAQELARSRNRPGAKMAVLRALRAGSGLGGLNPDTLLLPKLARLDIPVMVVWGAQDRIMPVEMAYEAKAKLPSLDLHVFDQCGHWPQMERAEEFNELVTSFVETKLRSSSNGHDQGAFL